jgi:uncharacterized protein YwgA
MFKSEYYILKLIGSSGDKVNGRKKLQKLFYIMKNLGFPVSLNFIYHRYGPYSPELSATISELNSLGLLKEDYKSQIYEYKITRTGKNFLKLLEKNKLVEKYATPEKLNNAVKFISQQDSSLLELVSTIMFLMEYGESYKAACKEALKLKPHLSNQLKEAKNTIQKLDVAV